MTAADDPVLLSADIAATRRLDLTRAPAEPLALARCRLSEGQASGGVEPRDAQVAGAVTFHGRPLSDEAALPASFHAALAWARVIDRRAPRRWFRVRRDTVTFWEDTARCPNRRPHYALRAGRWARLTVQS